MTSSQIAEIFAEEIAGFDGKVTDSIHDCNRLFARGVLPPSIDARPGDKLKGGVALCATETNIFVHPYVLRLVCTNGAIMAQATQTRQLRREEFTIDLETELRQAIRCCCERDAFVVAADQMRAARHTAADIAITMAAWITRHRGPMWDQFISQVFRRYEREADRSAYGLMNAVTSVARDASDPEMKWRLEEFGGRIPALLNHPSTKPRPSRAIARALAEVG